MPGTTTNNALRYPLATEAPDGPGAVLALATDVDALIQSGSWTPVLGGGSGAAIGANPIAEGSYMRMGKNVQAKGRIVFGSSASFGTGAATVTGFPVAITNGRSSGYGVFLTPGGGSMIPVFFTYADGANMHIRPVISGAAAAVSTLGNAYNLGTPAQSSELRFSLDLTST